MKIVRVHGARTHKESSGVQSVAMFKARSAPVLDDLSVLSRSLVLGAVLCRPDTDADAVCAPLSPPSPQQDARRKRAAPRAQADTDAPIERGPACATDACATDACATDACATGACATDTPKHAVPTVVQSNPADVAPRAKRCKKCLPADEGPVTLVERVDPIAARWVATHLTAAHLHEWDGTRQGFEWTGTKDDYVAYVRAAMRKYVQRGGKVTYTLRGVGAAVGMGRLVARGLSLQSMTRPIRALLAGAVYHDVDMVNAQPALLEQLAARKLAATQLDGWRAPVLALYNANRAAALAAVMAHLGCTRAAAKELLIALFFGLGAKAAQAAGLPPWFVTTLLPELARLRRMICDDAEYADACAALAPAFKAAGKSPSRSFPALVLQTLERKCLWALKGALERHERSVDALIHDGCEVRKLDGEATLPAALLRACEAAVLSATGYAVVLAVKPMTTTIVPPPEQLPAPAPFAVVTVADVQLAPDALAAVAAALAACHDVAALAGAITAIQRETAANGEATALLSLANATCPASGEAHDGPCVVARVTVGGFVNLRCRACPTFASPTVATLPLDVEVHLLGRLPSRVTTTSVPADVAVSDALAARAFVRVSGGHLLKDHAVMHGFDADSGVWGHADALLEAMVTRAGPRLALRSLAAGGALHDYAGSARLTAQLLKKLPSVMPATDGHFADRARIASSVGKLLFNKGPRKGVYDFATATFSDGFDPAIVFKRA